MTNDFRDLDRLIGLAPVSDMAPPLLGGRHPAPAPHTAAGSNTIAHGGGSASPASRPERTRRPTVVLAPTVSTRGMVTPPNPVHRPTQVVGVAAPSRPLLAAVSASTPPRGAEPVTPVVTLLAWLVLLLAAGNAYLMIRTGGWMGSDLPFTGQVDYSPTVTALMTWGGHPGWPIALSILGSAGLAAAATRTRALRQVGGAAGMTLFVSLLVALVGIAGSLAALLLIALATAIGITVVIASIAVLTAVIVMLLVGMASS